jgi:hypothetical protein
MKGERRSFALLRPIVDGAASRTIRDRILAADAAHEQRAAANETTAAATR